MPEIDEIKLMEIVRSEIARCKSYGQVYVSLPIELLEQLANKAQRPHD